MTDVKLAKKQAKKDAETRSRTVKPGHLEIGEFTSGHIGASSPFGRSDFPLPVSAIEFEPTEPVSERVLDEERH
ncbi:hypothetical protein [Glycomyces tarimensis]